jgi:serine/threonine protein kinase
MMETQFMMEIKMQFFFNHNNILKSYAVFDDSTHIYLVLEYMEEGTLYEKLKKLGQLPEKLASHISTDVLLGVAYLH